MTSRFSVLAGGRVTFGGRQSEQLRGSLITASRRQELRICAAKSVAEKIEGLHGALVTAAQYRH